MVTFINGVQQSLSVLMLSQLICSAPAKRSYTCGSNTLDDGCNISDDCDIVRCKMKFVDKAMTYKLEVNKCDDPVSVTASIDVPDLHISWSHTYTSDDIVEVPGFSLSVSGFPLSAGVYVQVSLTPDDDRLRLTVKLLAGGKIIGKGVYPVKATLIEGSLPIKRDGCGIFGWWHNLSDATKASVISGWTIIIILIISSCCCCCCCNCCNCRSSNQNTVIVQPTPAVGPVIMATTSTTTNANIPMQPMVRGF
ncbi:uncharacterized protein LOC111319746 [Stylophora pistillata]|uniref:Uncharacterized protein n=1 Tax=Stylophora pistillata TaxID=50429 RepID=A0A2B4R5B3_STYPI|nr:uncharacterized protein LOC111319746 [Stylophora pistillata]PFX11412.1 hypothetical protein AWC38_SpisGene24866 [Stylophora pistillata]